MRKLIKFAGIVAVMVASIQTLKAVAISGAIGFQGGVTFNTLSAATATEVTSWITPYVTLDTGTFAAPSPFAIKTGPTAAVTFAPGAWNFNTASPINSFWAVGGFTFQLLSSFVVSQGGAPGVNGYVVVDGTGIVSGNGYTPTPMTWSFTCDDPRTWTFSSTANSTAGAGNSVPDGGATAMLLGIALSAVALLKRGLRPALVS